VLIEQGRQLSRSLLWQAQRSFFQTRGVEAWWKDVPHYVTNNPTLATAYAAVALGFLRDVAGGADAPPRVDIVELGAGTGRFGYLFLTALCDLWSRSSARRVRFRYAMTDFTESVVSWLRAHPPLRSFVEQGILDFGVFDLERDDRIVLQESGEAIGPRASERPLLVISNYVFDSLPADAFSVEGGRLHEILVTLFSSAPAPAIDDLAFFDRVATTFERRPVPAGAGYYADPWWNEQLARYAQGPDKGTVIFPAAALRCLERLRAFAGGPLLILSADRGASCMEDVYAPGDPPLASHGSISLPVNYHAIGELVRAWGGQVLAPSIRPLHLAIVALLLGEHPTGQEETRLAYHQAIEQRSPDDLFHLRRVLVETCEQLDLDHLLGLVRVSSHDARVFADCLPALYPRVAAAPSWLRRDLVAAVKRAWAQHYPFGERVDLAGKLAAILFECGAHSDALALYRASLDLAGEDARTHWNIGVCCIALGREEEAVRSFARARALDPGFVPAGAISFR
jgi:hypothetical protein